MHRRTKKLLRLMRSWITLYNQVRLFFLPQSPFLPLTVGVWRCTGFMFYCLVVLCYSLYAIYRIAPKHGTSNPLVYISICSLVGSVSVMAVKGFGVALKLTFAGNNQLWRAGTWIFAVTVVGCIAVQMNYFNKVNTYSNLPPPSLSHFSRQMLIE